MMDNSCSSSSSSSSNSRYRLHLFSAKILLRNFAQDTDVVLVSSRICAITFSVVQNFFYIDDWYWNGFSMLLCMLVCNGAVLAWGDVFLLAGIRLFTSSLPLINGKCLPQSRREATGRDAILVDDMAASVQRRDGRVDLRCTARFVAFTGHRVAGFVSGSILRWRRGCTVAVSVGRSVGAVTVAVTIGMGDSVAVLVVSVGLGRAIGVTIGAGTIRIVATDRQIALHVVLGRSVRTVDLAEQPVVRVLAGYPTAWSFTVSSLLSIRSGEDVRLHPVLVHAAWSLGLVVGTKQIAASATWRLQNFARALGVFTESDGEVGGSHLGSC